MGYPPSLPFFAPQQVPAQPGVSHPVQGPAPGTLPYRMPALANAVQGFNDMVQSYHTNRRAEEQYWQDKLWQGIQWKMLGIGTVDDKTLMKWAENAGMPVKKRDPGQIEYEQQMQGYQQQMQDYQQRMQQYAQAQAAQAGAQAANVQRIQQAGQAPMIAGGPIGQAWGRIAAGTPSANVPGAGLPAPMEQAIGRIGGLLGPTPIDTSAAAAAAAAAGPGLPAPAQQAVERAAEGQAQAAAEPSAEEPPPEPGATPTPPTAPTPPPPAPRPGLFGRMKQAIFGVPGQVYDTSGLERLGQAVAEGGGLPEQVRQRGLLARADTALKLQSAENQSMILGSVKQAFLDPEHANWPLLRRFGAANSLGGAQDWIDMAPTLFQNEIQAGRMTAEQAQSYVGNTMLRQAMGIPQYMQARAQLIEKLRPNFLDRENELPLYVDDMLTKGYSLYNPGWSTQEAKDFASAFESNSKVYPRQTGGNVAAPSLAQIHGLPSRPYYDALDSMYQDPATKRYFPVTAPGRESTIAGQEFAVKTQQEQEKISIERGKASTQQYEAETGRINAGTQFGTMINNAQSRIKELDIQALNVFRESLNDQEKQAMNVLEHRDQYSYKEVQSAREQIANAATKGGDITLNYHGQPVSLRDKLSVVQGAIPGSFPSAIIPWSGTSLSALLPGEPRIALTPGRVPPAHQQVQPWDSSADLRTVLGGALGMMAPESRQGFLEQLRKDGVFSAVGDHGDQPLSDADHQDISNKTDNMYQPPTKQQVQDWIARQAWEREQRGRFGVPTGPLWTPPPQGGQAPLWPPVPAAPPR